MGVPFYAALDPIFWLHHANIDRLWVKWRAQSSSHQEPSNALWRNQSFSFYDENRTAVSLTPAQVLDTQASPLNYRYDDTLAPTLALLAPPKAMPGPVPPSILSPLVSVAPSPSEIGAAPVTVKLAIPPAGRTRMENSLAAVGANPTAGPAAQLLIEGVKFTPGAPAEVLVFLNLPDPSRPGKPATAHAVGVFSYFDGAHGNHEGAMRPGAEPEVRPVQPPAPGAVPQVTPDQPGTTAVFDLTRNIQSLKQAGAWKADEVNVTLVRHDLHPAGGDAPRTRITFQKVTIAVR
jgi:hypothetical protein